MITTQPTKSEFHVQVQKNEINEASLVSFGNYLFETYGVEQKNSQGNPMSIRQVTDADLQNFFEYEKADRRLPSRFQMNDGVNLVFFGSGKVNNANIIKVHFTESKVLYDVEIRLGDGMATRLYNVDSCFVEPAD